MPAGPGPSALALALTLAFGAAAPATAQSNNPLSHTPGSLVINPEVTVPLVNPRRVHIQAVRPPDHCPRFNIVGYRLDATCLFRPHGSSGVMAERPFSLSLSRCQQTHIPNSPINVFFDGNRLFCG